MAGRWFSLGTPVSSTSKTNCHNITEIFMKVALKYYKPTNQPFLLHATGHMLPGLREITPMEKL